MFLANLGDSFEMLFHRMKTPSRVSQGKNVLKTSQKFVGERPGYDRVLLKFRPIKIRLLKGYFCQSF